MFEGVGEETMRSFRRKGRFYTILGLCSITALVVYFSANKMTSERISSGQTLETMGKKITPLRIAVIPPHGPRKILLFAYARSGSSFTGDMIDKAPGTYYVFEPLRGVQTEPTEKKLAVLQEFFTCNFSASVVNDLLTRYIGNDAADLRRCQELKDPTNVTRCLHEAQEVCRRHARVVVKTIRTTMKEVGQLLGLYPDLDVLYLFRDPRAFVSSAMETFEKPTARLQKEARSDCTIVRANLEESRRVLHQYPGRLRFVRYERLADKPFQAFRNIYNFLRLNHTEAAIDTHVEIQTGRRNDLDSPAKLSNNWRRTKEDDPYSVSREDSAVAARRWRAEMPLRHLRIIEEECWELLILLGYRFFMTESRLRNVTMVPSEGEFIFLQSLPFSGLDLSP